MKAGQISGIGVFEVGTAPVEVTLINATAGDIYFPSSVTPKAGLVVTGYPDSAFGARMSQQGTFVVTDALVVVPLVAQSLESANIDYSTDDAIVIERSGIYRVDIFVTGAFSSTGGSQNVLVALFRNGVGVGELTQAIYARENENTTFGLTNFLSLDARDILTLRMVTGPEEGTFFFPITGYGATLTVQRVS